MKTFNISASFIALVAITFSAHAAILTVNNNTLLPGSPGLFTTVPAAITAASNGDTLLIAGSTIGYGDFTLNKKLTIVGPGYNPQKQNMLTASTGRITFTTGSSNSVITGVHFAGTELSSIIVSTGIRIYRNVISSSLNCSNGMILENNIILSNIYGKDATNIMIRNNYIQALITQLSSNTNIVKNNIFYVNYASPVYMTYIQNTAFLNNIFYSNTPLSGQIYSVCNPNDVYCTVKYNTFNNNLVYNYAPSVTTFSNNGNSASGNIFGVDPLMANFPVTDLATSNFRPAIGSPLINAGTDGTNIGPTGGGYNIHLPGVPVGVFALEPNYPQVYQMDFPDNMSAAPVGGSLNISVKARKKD